MMKEEFFIGIEDWAFGIRYWKKTKEERMEEGDKGKREGEIEDY